MIRITGTIGIDTTAQEVREALAANEGDLGIYIDSPGGDVMESNGISLAIAEYAVAHPGAKYTCTLGSLVASAAANILAKLPTCFAVSAYKDTLIMYHSCAGIVEGNPEQLRDYSVMMQLVNEAVINALASKTTLAITDIKAAFASGRELWLDGTEALKCGLVSSLIDAAPEQLQYTVNASSRQVLALVAIHKNLEAKMEEENKPIEATEETPTVTEPVAEGEEQVKEEIAKEVREELNEPAEETDWQAECDKLKAENDELKKELESLKALVAKYQPSAKPTATAAPKADWLALLRPLNALKLPEAEYAKRYVELKAQHKAEFDAFMTAHKTR